MLSALIAKQIVLKFSERLEIYTYYEYITFRNLLLQVLPNPRPNGFKVLKCQQLTVADIFLFKSKNYSYFLHYNF